MKRKIFVFIAVLVVLIFLPLFAQQSADSQTEFLQKIANTPSAKWKDLIYKNASADKDFITLCKDGASYSIVKNDFEQAYRFCYLADLAAQKLKLPDNYRLGLAFYCYNKKELTISLKICNILDKESYPDVRLPLITGLIYKEQKDFNSSINHLEKAAKLDPSNYDVHYNLGLAYIEAGNKEKAKEEFAKAIELKPDKKEAKTAAEALKEQEEVQGENISTLLQKAKDLMADGKKDEAGEVLKKCLKLDAKNYEIYLLLGKLSNQSEDFQLGINYLQQALDLNNQDPQVYYYMGYAYEHLYDKDKKDVNQLNEAKKNYTKAFDLDMKYDFAKGDIKRIDEKITKHEKMTNDKTQNPNESGNDK